MNDRPNINHTLNSLKSAMTAEEDQVLEEEHYDNANESFRSSFPSEARKEPVKVESIEIEEDDLEEVFSSEDIHEEVQEELEEIYKEPSHKDVFVLSKMIDDDGSVVNLAVESTRPSIDIPEDRIENIVREEARPLVKEWIDKNMYKLFKKN